MHIYFSFTSKGPVATHSSIGQYSIQHGLKASIVHPLYPLHPTRYLPCTNARASLILWNRVQWGLNLYWKFWNLIRKLSIVRLKRGKIVKLIANAKCAVKCAADLSPIVRFGRTPFSKEQKCPMSEKPNMALTFHYRSNRCMFTAGRSFF